MSAAWEQRGGVGLRARRRGRLLASLEGTIPWSALEQVGAQGSWGADTRGAAVEAPRSAWEQRLRALPRRVRRALQRHFALSLAELALLLALWQGPGWAAIIPVDGTTCTLMAAITAANTDAASGGCPAGSGADTLVLPAGSILTLTSVNNTTYGDTGLPVVSSAITIAGQGSTLTRSSADAFRLLAVGSGGALMLQDLTLQGGSLSGSGGAVLNQGTLTLTACTVSGNAASDVGGGVANSGTLTLTDGTLTGNTAYGGGGVYNRGTLTLTHSTLAGNIAEYDGGGVYNRGTLTLTHSTLAGNVTEYARGGGVYNAGSLTLAHSTLTGNVAFDGGGGVVSYGGRLTITNSTLTGNTATGFGGGVANFYSALTLAQTLVSGNSAGFGSGPEVDSVSATLSADAFNLFGQQNTAGVSGFIPGATDLVPTVALSAILAPTLAFNGGPTPTHALVVGSPALDAVPTGSCPASDQRGFVRPAGAACDIGAVEADATVPPAVTSPVAFAALVSSFSTTPDTTGCPGGVGQFFFQAQLTNQAGGLGLEALKAQVAELSNGNLLLTADQTPGGPGALQTLPEVEGFSDGVLEPSGTVTVPFVICLQSLTPFRFTVDLLGLQQVP